MTQLKRSLVGVMRTGAGIAVAMAVMNVATYGFTMFAAWAMGPRSYGAFAAMMNVLLVVGVVSLGLQTTAARRISADPAHVGQIQTQVLRVTVRASLLLGLVLVLLAPVVDRVLRLDSLVAAALVGVAVVPLTMMGGYAGILQGERRWLPLSVLYAAAGVPRLVIGVGILALDPTPVNAFLAIILGSLLPIAVGWYALRHERVPGGSTRTHAGREIVRETLKNSQALLAFFALANADLIVSRNVLDAHDSGLYAGGLILTKAMLFLPQFVVVVAFPAMTSAEERKRALARSLGLIAGLGVLGALAAWLLAPLAIYFVGGAQFGEIQGSLWLFAILGSAHSMLQLVVYSVIARQGQRSVYLVWGALVAMVTGALMTGSVVTLISWVIIVDLGLLLALTVISFRMVEDHPAPSASEHSPA
ncbi:polysaccharide biosynthesis protein [Nocardioides solisilvae]|uniref:polysaccharide biosynthesis protein n=1 Tax=Nocardioides solisilvae TaxID=1542435 RepID=UPI001EF63FBA|nr:polysaccharide biosynthesis protein [Nocardioides solisilvae]